MVPEQHAETTQYEYAIAVCVALIACQVNDIVCLVLNAFHFSLKGWAVCLASSCGTQQMPVVCAQAWLQAFAWSEHGKPKRMEVRRRCALHPMRLSILNDADH